MVTFITVSGDNVLLGYVERYESFAQIRCGFAGDDRRGHSGASCCAMLRDGWTGDALPARLSDEGNGQDGSGNTVWKSESGFTMLRYAFREADPHYRASGSKRDSIHHVAALNYRLCSKHRVRR
jgi:hypothetical protein